MFFVCCNRFGESGGCNNSRSELAHLEVQLVVEVPVDLLGVAVLAQQPAQHAHAADPQDLGGQPRLAGSPPLACAGYRATVQNYASPR